MAGPDQTVRELLAAYGQTFAAEIGIELADRPSPLFRLLCAALLFSTRINAALAVAAARALAEQGWTTPEKLAAASWDDRTATLNQAGYARYDERTSTQLGDTAELLMNRYDGDLRRLREEAGRDPSKERSLLKEFKGIGEVGCDIFYREAQAVWDELYPFVDRRALSVARRLDLGHSAQELAGLVDRADFPRLTAALVRVDLAGAQATGVGRRSLSRQQLYDRAKALDISGRSKMTKAELAEAIDHAES